MPTDRNRRIPWIAALLQLVTSGLGHLYCGRPLRGCVLHVCMVAAAMTGILALAWLPGFLSFLIVVTGISALFTFLIVDAWRCARAANPGYQRARYNRWYVYILVAIAVPVAHQFILPPILEAHWAGTFQSPVPAMEPTLLVGDNFIADKAAYRFSKPERGDIAIYRAPGNDRIYVHRIIALPGESIEIRDSTVFINGQELEESYAFWQRTPYNDPRATLPPTTMAENSYFLLGDNRYNSLDSRHIGPIQGDSLLGQARMLYFSRDRQTGWIRWKRIGQIVK